MLGSRSEAGNIAGTSRMDRRTSRRGRIPTEGIHSRCRYIFEGYHTCLEAEEGRVLKLLVAVEVWWLKLARSCFVSRIQKRAILIWEMAPAVQASPAKYKYFVCRNTPRHLFTSSYISPLTRLRRSLFSLVHQLFFTREFRYAELLLSAK